MFQLAMTVVLALALVFGGGATTAVLAQNAQPDDVLYGVKLWTEDVRLDLESTPAEELELALEFANRRAAEVHGALQAEAPVPEPLRARFENQLQQMLRLASDIPDGEIVPALDRGLLDGAEFNNATSDRLLGFPDVSKVCMLQSYHQNAESFEILFNKTKYDALPDKMKAIIANAVEAASADLSWKAIDRYSKDYIELQTKDKVKFYKTPDPILQKQLEVFDQVSAKKAAENPLWKEIVESQRAFAARAVAWDQDTNISRRMAYNHYFGKKAPEKKS